MAFISVQQETLLNDIIKTWIDYLKTTGSFSGITFKVDTPDTDLDLILPLIVLKRVSNDAWSISRNGGYYGTRNSTATEEKTLYGYTYSSLVQFDIMATSVTECNRIQGLISKSLVPTKYGNKTYIPLKTFILVNPVGVITNLQMKFTFHNDVDLAVIPSFDPNLHQHSISINFTIDYLSEVINPKILTTSFNYNIN